MGSLFELFDMKMSRFLLAFLFCISSLYSCEGSSELGNRSPRMRKICPRECSFRTFEILKTRQCKDPKSTVTLKCVFNKLTSDSVKPCLPCVCENICKVVAKGGPNYKLCTDCRSPPRA